MTPRSAPVPNIWAGFVYRDAPAAIRFLTETFGFQATLVVPDEHDPQIVVHSQLSWPEGGTVMVTSADRPGNVFSARPIGGGLVYVVTDRVTDLAKNAAEAGCEFVQELSQSDDYDGLGFAVRDPEGNIWGFGTYRGEPAEAL